jgi:integrase
MTTRQTILGGKVQLFRRPRSPYWQCAASVAGHQFTSSTKQESLAHAKETAEDWYLNLRGKDRWGGGLPKGKSFRKAAEKFLEEFEVLTNGERSPKYVSTLRHKIDKHLNPFFGDKPVTEINESLIQDYRVERAKPRTNPKTGKELKHPHSGESMRPARTTIHHEIITLRHVLKTAKRHGWLTHLPDLSAPYKASGKITHRAWFSLEDYRALYTATKSRARHPPNPKWKWECEQFHDYVLFMANTGLRPDEAGRLEFRDVVIVDDDDPEERILEIEVRGKRGVGYCKSMPGAVRPFERLRDRKRAVLEETPSAPGERKGISRGGAKKESKAKPGQTDRIFGPTQRELMNTVLGDLKLKFDRDGQRRTAYSLRHTYICFRLMEGADIYQIAKNCRTSVEMIEKYYASHIKNMLDASAINVRRSKDATKHKVGELTKEAV